MVSDAWNLQHRLMSACSPRGYCSLKSRGAKQACVTLQRPPPETRTFVRNCGLFSRIVTSVSGAVSAQAIAAKKPAAPPPAITTRRELIAGSNKQEGHGRQP